MRWIALFSLSFSLLQAELFFTPEMIASHLKGYSEEEVGLIDKDLAIVRSICFQEASGSDTPFYLATAGAPGARKTTILEKFIANHPEYQGAAYIDPDPRTLRFMAHTYYAKSLSPLAIATDNNYDQTIKNAYTKWRGGSNYIALTLLEEAFAGQTSVAHGTTCTGGHLSLFFPKLKENNYQIVLLLCSCPDELRSQAIAYRNNTVRFYQSSPEDAIGKGVLFAQRMPSYFAHADLLYFYWSDDLFAPERLAGIWSNGTLEVLDSGAMDLFIEKYEADRAILEASGTFLPSFNSLILI